MRRWLLLLLLAPGGAWAQAIDFSKGGPIEVTSRDGMEWRQNEQEVIAQGSARAVRVSFKRLFDDGLAYRTEALINWCPGCRTSVSDLEVIPTAETGTLWTIGYHLIDVHLLFGRRYPQVEFHCLM